MPASCHVRSQDKQNNDTIKETLHRHKIKESQRDFIQLLYNLPPEDNTTAVNKTAIKRPRPRPPRCRSHVTEDLDTRLVQPTSIALHLP